MPGVQVYRTASEEETIALGERIARELPLARTEIRICITQSDERQIEVLP